jgi:hypothetical protein
MSQQDPNYVGTLGKMRYGVEALPVLVYKVLTLSAGSYSRPTGRQDQPFQLGENPAELSWYTGL